MLLIAFSIKAAVFPLSAWLPDSYPTAPAPVTAVFAGLLTKVGVYAIIRTQTLLFPDGALDDVLMWAALATMLIGILGAVAQTDIRRILSFTLVSHIGYMIFGISLGTTAGLAGAIFYVAHHIAIQTTLFLVAGLIERQGGSTAVDRLGGLAGSAPLLAVLFFVPAVNLAGIPPLSGFIGKLGLLQAGVEVGSGPAYVLVASGVVTSLLTLIAVARVWTRAFWRPVAQAPSDDTAAAAAADAGPDTGGPVAGDGYRGRRAAREAAWQRHTDVATAAATADPGRGGSAENGLPRLMVATTAAMVALTVALTAIAGPLYGLADRAAADLLERTPYIEAVFGDGEVP
jgi:multicomponent Na+:H+ antiporter subunit D